MRILGVVALVATFLTTTAVAESAEAQLAAILPTCAVRNVWPPFWYEMKTDLVKAGMHGHGHDAYIVCSHRSNMSVHGYEL